MGEFVTSDDYANFRAWVPRNILSIGSVSPKNFVYYDWGPRNVTLEPLICLHAVAGAAEVFFLQILGLAPRGYRVISLEIPSYFSVEEFCQGFQSFLDSLGFKRVHIYGAGLGGFLGLCYASRNVEQVGSLVLTHSFFDTSRIRVTFPVSSSVIPWLPEFLLRKFVLERLPKGRMERRVAAATEFVISKIKQCDSEKLASRLFLTTVSEKVDAASLRLLSGTVTILSSLDWIAGSSLSKQLHQELVEQFSQGRVALLKDGGDFPYLSRSDEINVHLMVHLRRYAMPPGTPLPLPPPARKRDAQPVFRVSKGSPSQNINSNGRFVGSEASKIAKLKELLPDYNEEFLEAALLVYHGSLEDTLQGILEGSLPDHFSEKSSDFTQKTGGMNIEAKVASTQQGTEESALEENLLLPPKQTNRGVVERNPLAYDKSSNEVDSGSEAAASSERFVDNTGQVYVEPQMLQIQTESYNRDTTSEVSFLQGPSLTTSFVPDNNMRQDIRIGMQSDAYHSNFDSTLQTANTKVTDSLDSQTRATSDSELTGQTNVTSENVSHWRNGSESDSSEVIDSRLLEWKMSAYTSPSFQKPQ